MTSPVAPVLVVGAGPAGLVLALSLVKQGIKVRIIDKAPAHKLGERGAGLQPRSLEIFHFLGMLEDFHKVAIRLPRTKFYQEDGITPLKVFDMSPHIPPTPDTPFSNPLLLGQDGQEIIFRSHLHQFGCDVELGSELHSFEERANGIVAHIVKTVDGSEMKESASFSYIIGADGARSVVRKQLGINFLGETRKGENWLIGDIEVKEGLTDDFWHGWGEPTTGMFSLRATAKDKGIFTLFVVGPNPDHDHLASSREAFIEGFYNHTGRRDIVFGKLIWMSTYRPNIRMVDKMGEGRAFIAGDAAHCHSPTGGQGMNSSIQDSFNLGWKIGLILQGLAKPALLNTYSKERLPVIAEMLNKTTELLDKSLKTGRIESADTKESGWYRGGELHQLGVNYRGSPIVVNEESQANPRAGSAYNKGPGVAAGDRAPNAPGLLDHSRGRAPMQLFDIFGPAHHTALIFRGDQQEHVAVSEVLRPFKGCFRIVLLYFGDSPSLADAALFDVILEDHAGHAVTGYQIGEKGRPRTVIVRPDAMIGAMVYGAEGVKRYLKKVFA